MKKAFITGISGQDGRYLADYLLRCGYEVHGLCRWSSVGDVIRFAGFDFLEGVQTQERFHIHYGDMSDGLRLVTLLDAIRPDEVYNLAAMSHVHESFSQPAYTADIDAGGTLRLLEAIRIVGLGKEVRFYQASSSEMYGNMPAPQSEDTPFAPRSPYASAKLYGYWITRNYRESYGLFAANGILFNHESPLRGEHFVTRKITRAVAAIALGAADEVRLGNLDAKRDWGHAKDYVQAMYMMLQHDRPDDFVIATGQARTVLHFAQMAFAEIGIELEFTGKGASETAVIANIDGERFFEVTQTMATSLRKGQVVLRVDKEFFRPAEIDCLIGEAHKAHTVLGWAPQYDLADLVHDMVRADLALARAEAEEV